MLSTRRIMSYDDNEVVEDGKVPCSPDEIVISQRGRRSLPEVWSPDVNLRKQSYHNNCRSQERIMNLRSRLKSSRYMRSLLGPEECHKKKSQLSNKCDSEIRSSANMVTNHSISFTPEKLDLIDMTTPLKLKLLLAVENQEVKKPAFKLNLDAGPSKSHISGPKKRVLDKDSNSSLSTVKRFKS